MRLTPRPALHLAFLLALAALPACGDDGRVSLTVDPDTRYQTIEGWGTCLVAWQAPMRELYRTDAFQRLYVETMGLNLLRVNMWGPTLHRAVEDPSDIRAADYDLDADGGRARIFIDFAKGLKRLDPDVRLIGTVWSPPAWMKLNRSIKDTFSGAISGASYDAINKGAAPGQVVDNRVDPRYYPHFVAWVVEYVRLHAEAGVPFHAVSLGNEVMFTQTFESCVWTAADFATVNGMAREALDAAGCGDVKLFGPATMTGHNWGPNRGNALYIEALSGDDGPLDVWATHGYTDGFTADRSADSSAAFRKLIDPTGKPYWMTEGGTGSHDWPAALHDVGAMLHNALTVGNAAAVVPWQITGGKPSEHELMVGSTLTAKSHVARHYFRYIRPGAARVGMTGDAAIPTSAYLHEQDRTLTVVLTNPGDAAVTVSLAVPGSLGVTSFDVVRTSDDERSAAVDPVAVTNGTATLTLPGPSIVTLVGRY